MTHPIKNLVADALEATGAQFATSSINVAQLMATRSAELAVLVGQPGYEQAIIAARDEVALFAAIRVVDGADKATARLLSVIHGGLMLLAGGLA